MAVQNILENVILVDLPRDPESADDLKEVTEIVGNRTDCDVVIDFSGVDIITSPKLAELLKLNKLLADCGHRLIFCGVTATIKAIFILTDLDKVFEFADDKTIALAYL